MSSGGQQMTQPASSGAILCDPTRFGHPGTAWTWRGLPWVWFVGGILALAAVALAGQYNPVLKIGDAAPDWSGLEGTDGKKYALADFKDKEVLVLCFTCNTCPYAVDHEDRLIALARKFAAEGGKAALIAINANLVPDDLLPAMRQRANQKGFNFPYLHDATQAVAKSYGATYTPEFVVLDASRKVVYLGAMDDSPDGKSVRRRYVEEAVAAALAGRKPEVTETPAVGCAIRYVRSRQRP
jgi:peroxiredoxin